MKHGKDAFLVLTTDGVHFVMNEVDLLHVVCQCQDPGEAAKFLTDQAMQFGSEDNGTAIVVPFGAWGKYAPPSNFVRVSFGQMRYWRSDDFDSTAPHRSLDNYVSGLVT